MLTIGIICMSIGALEIFNEISNTFSERKDGRGYIVWHYIIIGAIVFLFGFAWFMTWFLHHVQ